MPCQAEQADQRKEASQGVAPIHQPADAELQPKEEQASHQQQVEARDLELVLGHLGGCAQLQRPWNPLGQVMAVGSFQHKFVGAGSDGQEEGALVKMGTEVMALVPKVPSEPWETPSRLMRKLTPAGRIIRMARLRGVLSGRIRCRR